MTERHFLSGIDGTLECRGDLLTRVLSGVATQSEHLAFLAHLKTCESCQLSHAIRGDFERVSAFSDDSVRVAQIAARALAIHKATLVSSKTPWNRKAARSLAVAALALGSAAAAATFLVPLAKQNSAPAASTTDSSPSSGNSTAQPHKSGAAASVPVVTDDDASSRPEIGVEVTPVRAEDSSQRAERLPISSTALDPSSAQALFRAANQERRHGNSVEAVRLYRKLQQQFSGSSEATLSLVALGGLLLKSSQAAGALTQFDRYLAGGAKGPLTAEALYGRGQALQRLGRKNEETQNWQRLLKSYPTSPYSFEARRRIDALR